MLPEEVWLSIFGFEEWWKLAAYQRVSKEWQKNVIYSWNTLEMAQVCWYDKHRNKKYQILLQNCRNLKSFEFDDPRQSLELAMMNPNLRQLKTNLSAYDVGTWYHSQLMLLRQSCPLL